MGAVFAHVVGFNADGVDGQGFTSLDFQVQVGVSVGAGGTDINGVHVTPCVADIGQGRGTRFTGADGDVAGIRRAVAQLGEAVNVGAFPVVDAGIGISVTLAGIHRDVVRDVHAGTQDVQVSVSALGAGGHRDAADGHAIVFGFEFKHSVAAVGAHAVKHKIGRSVGEVQVRADVAISAIKTKLAQIFWTRAVPNGEQTFFAVKVGIAIKGGGKADVQAQGLSLFVETVNHFVQQTVDEIGRGGLRQGQIGEFERMAQGFAQDFKGEGLGVLNANTRVVVVEVTQEVETVNRRHARSRDGDVAQRAFGVVDHHGCCGIGGVGQHGGITTTQHGVATVAGV